MNTIFIRAGILWGAAFVAFVTVPAHGKSIVDSMHNLSISGPGAVKATTQTEICIFCHTPHNARPDIPYLWNRLDPAGAYTPYASTTLKAAVGQPTGTSRLCLSCHDGTIAPGAVLSQTAVMPFTASMSGRSSNLGINLADDHPVSFDYSAAAALNGQLKSAALLPSNVRLDATGQMQCTACHNPHNDQYGKFLVMSNLGAALCVSCHSKTNWSGNSHATSPKTWNGTAPDPWPSSSYTTVAANGCGNCHRPHNAAGEQRLLNYAVEETTCLVCHNGNVATKNISADLAKIYRHPVDAFTGFHDTAENYAGTVSKHVECVDCHNPHQVVNSSSTDLAPWVPGILKGVPGVDLYTNAYIPSATYEYQICFKCHGALINNVLTTPPPITRSWPTTRDNRTKFTGVSFHPVVNPLNKISDNMLVAPWAKGSMLHCTDCHGSDSGGARGSHGSIYPFILVAEYKTSELLPTSATAYLTDSALCFKCHRADTLFGSTAKFPQHRKHLNSTTGTNERCSYCHDPHGSPYPGMINFDMRPGIVSLSGGKPIQLIYVAGQLGNKNTCVLTCHGYVHGS
ncbi:MAG: cytochrome c3 family protein [Desulfuromonadaceae bacterium]|nr:cytochrome c3 family protein [Desulfuromonadaceae bacterium]